MPNLGACVVVFESDKILLTKREDFEIWCLPGGHIEDGESAAQAAVREVFEETGLEVELTHLIGVYYRDRGGEGAHIFSFAARPLGGTLKPQPGEVIDIRYFALDEIPEVLLWGHHQRIQDALDGWSGSVARYQNIPWPFEKNLSRQELYDLRDQSGLSPSDFYAKHFAQPGAETSHLEAGKSETSP